MFLENLLRASTLIEWAWWLHEAQWEGHSILWYEWKKQEIMKSFQILFSHQAFGGFCGKIKEINLWRPEVDIQHHHERVLCWFSASAAEAFAAMLNFYSPTFSPKTISIVFSFVIAFFSTDSPTASSLSFVFFSHLQPQQGTIVDENEWEKAATRMNQGRRRKFLIKFNLESETI